MILFSRGNTQIFVRQVKLILPTDHFVLDTLPTNDGKSERAAQVCCYFLSLEALLEI